MGWPEAMWDAATVIRNNDLRGNPQVLLSDDGIMTIEWHRGNHGVTLLFVGDGNVSIAFRRQGMGYAENGMNVSVNEALPQAFHDALAQIANDNF